MVAAGTGYRQPGPAEPGNPWPPAEAADTLGLALTEQCWGYSWDIRGRQHCARHLYPHPSGDSEK